MTIYYLFHPRPRFPMENSPSAYRPPNLKGRVALVAGATRGLGRGIALALGESGATVYCTGRSTAANRIPRNPNEKISPFDHARRPETIDETAALVTARGGKGIAAVVDHTDTTQVKTLIDRIRSEQEKASHPRQRHLRTRPSRLRKTLLAARSRRRSEKSAQRRPDARHHQPFRSTAAHRNRSP